jgi:GTP-binding protein YchF
VPDARLDRLAEITRPKKVTHAAVEFVDLPGITRREREKAVEAESRNLTTYLTTLKNAEALAHVVRAFDDDNIPHLEGTVDPARDISLLELEMILSDLAVVEKRLDRLSKDLKKIKSAELESEYQVLERLKSALESEQALRELDLAEEERRLVRGFTFLSAKPMLIVLNLGDGDVSRIPTIVGDYGLHRQAAKPQIKVTAVCGKIEAELAALSPQDARAFMDDFGLSETGLVRIINQSYSLLGLISFYTISENEDRAWAIPNHTPALKAAGMIHTDFERGFIKAEVVAYKDMVEAGSFQAARSKGLLRVEGKEYPIQDADVVLFRFNV